MQNSFRKQTHEMTKAEFFKYPAIWRYVIAVALVILALFMSDALWDIVKDTPFPFFVAAVALSAWIGGLGPGLLATVLSIVLLDYFLLSPLQQIFTSPRDILQFVIFAAVAMLVSWLDMARRRAISAVNNARDELQALVDHIGEGITAQDASGKVIYANEAAAHLTGHASVADMLNMSVDGMQQRYQMFDEYGEPFTNANLPRQQVFSEGKRGEVRFRMRNTADDSERWIHLVTAPVFGPGKKPRLAVNIFRDITPTIYEQLRLQRILDNLPALVGVMTTDGILTESNKVALDIAGLKRADVIGKPFDQTYWWAYSAEVQAQLREAIAAAARGELVRYDVVVRTGDNQYATIDFMISPLRDKSGEIVALIPAAIDVTQRKKIERDREYLNRLLSQEQARLKILLGNLPSAVWESKPEGQGQFTPTFVSEYSEQLFGYSAQDWVNEPDLLLRILHPDDRERVTQEFSQPPEDSRIVQYRIITKGGDLKHVETRSKLIRDAASGQYTLVGTTSDISQQKRWEAELERLNDLLEIQRERLANILANVPGVVWESNITPDGEQHLLYISPYVETMLGYSVEEMMGNEEIWRNLVHPDDREATVAQITRLYENEATGTVQFRMVKKDGGFVPVEAYLTLPKAPARFGTIYAVMMDISERRQSEQRIANYVGRLRRSNQSLQQFAYVASHDLQEPLRMVSSYLQLLETRYRDQLDDDAKEFIDFAVDGAVRMKQLINDLLAYSRVETRKGDFTPVDLTEVFAQVQSNLSVRIAETNATVTSENLPTLNADKGQMLQLLQNLVGNALKFHGEAPPVVHVSAKPVTGAWQISVCDNGIGIDPKYGERIFEIFQRLHGRSKYPGTGIGLAICRRVVERHGGRIWFESEPGQGTTFHFTVANTLKQGQGAEDDE
ncbi:MAG: PAS domain S-box protein [Anaerolineae bacterium]|nr:PAS domain S-box protein [Anaerolineae bacterium]